MLVSTLEFVFVRAKPDGGDFASVAADSASNKKGDKENRDENSEHAARDEGDNPRQVGQVHARGNKEQRQHGNRDTRDCQFDRMRVVRDSSS